MGNNQMSEWERFWSGIDTSGKVTEKDTKRLGLKLKASLSHRDDLKGKIQQVLETHKK